MSEATPSAETVEPDAWKWWESRRLTYNLALAGAGCVAYGAHLALIFAFGRPTGVDASRLISVTLFMGSGYLVMMFIANICYLLGVLVESWTKPVDRAAYRKHAFALGLWASAAVPFLLPLNTLARLISAPLGGFD